VHIGGERERERHSPGDLIDTAPALLERSSDNTDSSSLA